MIDRDTGPRGWGSPEVRAFFDEANRFHLDTGVYQAYSQAMDDMIEDYEGTEAQEVFDAARAQLPLATSEGYRITDDQGIGIGAAYALQKVKLEDGSNLPYSIMWVANVEYGRVVERNPFFTQEQAEFVILQALKQRELGIET